MRPMLLRPLDGLRPQVIVLRIAFRFLIGNRRAHQADGHGHPVDFGHQRLIRIVRQLTDLNLPCFA